MRILHDYECEHAETDICTCGVDEVRHYKTTIARLTKELAETKAALGMAYEAAEIACNNVIGKRIYFTEKARDDDREFREAIRALNPDATAALGSDRKRVRDEETRACAGVVRERRQGWLAPYILARIYQRKEKSS